MRPIEPPEYEDTVRQLLLGPLGVEPLVVRVDADGTRFSVWELTADERGAILDGARVILSVRGPHPAVGLGVEGVGVR